MFSTKEAVKYGWEKLKANLEVGILTTLLLLAVSFMPGSGFLGLVLFVFLIILRIGYTKIFLRINDGETPRFVDIFEEYRIFWRYLGTSVLSFLTILGGFILLIIPGIFWAIRFSLAPLIVVDTKLSPIASMKESYAITKGNFWNLFLFWIVIGLINMVGVILFVIGLLVTIPISTLASIYVYRELSKQKAGLTAQVGLTTASPQTV